jgi:copper resistance protein D
LEIYRIVLIIHILSAITWIGGVIFIELVVFPVVRSYETNMQRRVLSDVGRRFRTIGWLALSALVFSGGYLLWQWGAGFGSLIDGSFFANPRNRLLGIKVAMVVLMLCVSAVHDWYLGPKTSSLLRAGGDATKLRRMSSCFARTNGALILIITILAIFVARGGF